MRRPPSAPPPLPLSLAGRLPAVMDLLAPVTIETCPTCGAERRVVGQPLISKEEAARMLGLPELPEPEPKP